MTYTKEDIIEYLIDSIGYSEEDLKELTKKDLLNMIERPTELKMFCSH